MFEKNCIYDLVTVLYVKIQFQIPEKSYYKLKFRIITNNIE